MRVCHRRSTARRSASSCSACSSGESSVRSRSSSRRAIFHWQSRMLLRCTSVGCAVSTGTHLGAGKEAGESAHGRRCRPSARGPAPCARLPSRGAAPARAWCAAAADVVLVLGDVGQVREVAEGAHHQVGALARQARAAGHSFLRAPRCRYRDGSAARAGGSARRGRRPRRPPVRARCRRAGGRAGGCRRAGVGPCRRWGSCSFAGFQSSAAFLDRAFKIGAVEIRQAKADDGLGQRFAGRPVEHHGGDEGGLAGGGQSRRWRYGDRRSLSAAYRGRYAVRAAALALSGRAPSGRGTRDAAWRTSCSPRGCRG
jgi:hypothetical protein